MSSSHFVILCVLSSIVCAVFATQASEREAQSVSIKFYQMSTSEWTTLESTFKSLVSAQAVTYCTSNSATCGLASGFLSPEVLSEFGIGSLFTSSEIGINSGPTEESKTLEVEVYIDFPTVSVVDASSSTHYVVNAAAVTTIMTNIMEELESTLGHDITYIGEEYYGIDPDSTMNKIIIPVAFIVLFAMIVLAVALHMWNKRKEEAEKKKKHLKDREKRKKGSRITPVFTVQTEDKQPNNFWPRRSRKKKTLKKATFEEPKPNGDVPTLSMKTNMMTFDSDQAADKQESTHETKLNYEDQVVVLRNSALPPLDEQKEKERKRKKREKRRQKKESGEEGGESESDKSKCEQNEIPVEDDTPAAGAAK